MAERGEGLRANRAASRAFTGRIAQLKEADKVDSERAKAQAEQAAKAGPERRPALDLQDGEVVQFKTDAPETELVDPEAAEAMSASSVQTDESGVAEGVKVTTVPAVKKAPAKQAAAKKAAKK